MVRFSRYFVDICRDFSDHHHLAEFDTRAKREPVQIVVASAAARSQGGWERTTHGRSEHGIAAQTGEDINIRASEATRWRVGKCTISSEENVLCDVMIRCTFTIYIYADTNRKTE